MTPKELVLDFYKNDLILDKSEVNEFLHPDILIEWNSSKGFIQMNKEDVLNLTDQLNSTHPLYSFG